MWVTFTFFAQQLSLTPSPFEGCQCARLVVERRDGDRRRRVHAHVLLEAAAVAAGAVAVEQPELDGSHSHIDRRSAQALVDSADTDVDWHWAVPADGAGVVEADIVAAGIVDSLAVAKKKLCFRISSYT